MSNRFDRFEVTSITEPMSCSLSQPPARTLILRVWPGEMGEDAVYETYPVLAIQVAARHYFDRDNQGVEHVDPPSLATAKEYGWRHTESGTHHEYIIDERGEGLGEASSFLDSIEEPWRIVVADWPSSEDGSRLAEIILEMRQEASDLQSRRSSSLAGEGFDARPKIPTPMIHRDRPTEIHENPCARCPSMMRDDDPESLDILGCGEKGYLLDSLFPCAWRPSKLCRGWHDKVMRAVETLEGD